MITAKPKTYTEACSDAMQRYKAEICRLLHWDDEKYAVFQYKAGLAYLYWYLPCSDVARRQLEGSKIYWNWFKTVWAEHDFVFANSYGIDNISLGERIRIYEALQCPKTMAVDIKPNAVVLSEIKTKTVL